VACLALSMTAARTAAAQPAASVSQSLHQVDAERRSHHLRRRHGPSSRVGEHAHASRATRFL